MFTIYTGEYTVPAFGGNNLNGGTYTSQATTGCVFVELAQPVGGTAGQLRKRAVTEPTASPSPNAFAAGEPNETENPPQNFSLVDEGSLTSLTITNLTATSGTGTFTFTNSASTTVTGTLTITGSETTDINPDIARRRAQNALIMRKAYRR